MSKRAILIGAAWVLCLGTVSAVLVQRSELMNLRARQKQGGEPTQSVETPAQSGEATPADASLSDSNSRELMRLRGEVTRLTARKRELAGVAEAAEQLHAQLAGGQATSGGVPLPPGYLRKADARFVGYSTPENSFQSFFWALQHHDVSNILASFSLSGQEGQGIRRKVETAADAESFFKGTDPMPGFVIQGRQESPDGSVELQVVFGPGMPPQSFHMQSTNGEWKIAD